MMMAGRGALASALTQQRSCSSGVCNVQRSSGSEACALSSRTAGTAPNWARTAAALGSTYKLHRRGVVANASTELADGLSAHLLPTLAAIQTQAAVGLAPCNVIKCGDLVYTSTLDPVLRGEVTGTSWSVFVLAAAVVTYLFVPPGVLPGAIDYYVLAKLRNRNRAYSKDDITLGRKIGSGGFGSAFLGEMRMADGTIEQVIVKKAKEFGEAEAWMNERMTRLGGAHVAEFITAFDETLSMSAQEQALRERRRRRYTGVLADDAVWLVWKYEGDNTLYDLMESKAFPLNLEPYLLDRELQVPVGPERKAVTVRLALKQLLEALAAAHSTGIVHRDVKPQNCIVSERDKKVKLIDLGAAADLRVGINYMPNEYLLDPRYAPPQQYVMSTQTPTPPPAPVAAFLSPVLWRMETPDRFDMYSCGITLLQMAFPHLRNDNNLIAFNKRFEALNYDLRAWRAEEEARKGGPKPDVAEGFALLDLDDGAGWKLLCGLLAFNPADRPTAAQALVSPFFTGSALASPTDKVAIVAASQSALSAASRALAKSVDPRTMADLINGATGQDRGALTEAMLTQEFDQDEPKPDKRARHTIAWWNERQNEMRKSIERRQGEGSRKTSGLQPQLRGQGIGSPGQNGKNGKNGNNGNGKKQENGVPKALGWWGGSGMDQRGEERTGADEREVELMGQRQQRGGRLGFLGNVLGGGGRHNGKNDQ